MCTTSYWQRYMYPNCGTVKMNRDQQSVGIGDPCTTVDNGIERSVVWWPSSRRFHYCNRSTMYIDWSEFHNSHQHNPMDKHIDTYWNHWHKRHCFDKVWRRNYRSTWNNSLRWHHNHKYSDNRIKNHWDIRRTCMDSANISWRKHRIVDPYNLDYRCRHNCSSHRSVDIDRRDTGRTHKRHRIDACRTEVQWMCSGRCNWLHQD